MNSKHHWFVLLAVSVGSLMAGLDTSVSNTILPLVAASLRAEVTATQWVVLIYLLITTVLVLSAGRLGDLHGHRRLYVLGLGIFVVSSAACGLAPTIGWLIAARGCQAVGAAMLVSNAPALLTRAFPDQQRGRALGLQSTALTLGLVIGPSLGGMLAASFGWGAVFLINVPIGSVGLLLSLRFLPHDKLESSARERFDLPGAVTLSLGLVALVLGLNRASAWGLISPGLWACFAATVVCLTAFFWIERHTSVPVLDLELFRNRQFSTAVAAATLNFAAGFAMQFVFPFYLIQGRGLSPTEAGLMFSAVPVVMLVVSPLSGALSDRIGTRPPAIVGAVIVATASLALTSVGVETPGPAIVGVLFVLGLGVALFNSPTASAILGAAPRERRGIASGVMSTARGIGMVVGFALGGAVFTAVLGQGGLEATPSSIAQAADATLLLSAVLAILATVALIYQTPSGQGALASWTRQRLARFAWSTRQV
ncbi:MAG TPA: MFS transporter [Chloroflexota bacterium]